MGKIKKLFLFMTMVDSTAARKGIYTNLLTTSGQLERLSNDAQAFMKQMDEARAKNELTVVKNEEKEITNITGKKLTALYSGETNAKGEPHGEGMFQVKDGVSSQGLYKDGNRYGFTTELMDGEI